MHELHPSHSSLASDAELGGQGLRGAVGSGAGGGPGAGVRVQLQLCRLANARFTFQLQLVPFFSF